MYRLTVALLLWPLLVSCHGSDAPTAPAKTGSAVTDGPITSARFVSVHGSKPPLRNYVLSMHFYNNHKRPMWVVLPYSADRALPLGDRLVAPPESGFQFGERVLSRLDSGDLRRVNNSPSRAIVCYGQFIAFRLQPNEVRDIPDAFIESWAPIAAFFTIDAGDIQLDGVSLDQWLATRKLTPEGYYATLSTLNQDAQSPGRIARGARPLPQDIVRTINFIPAFRWQVVISGIDKAPADPWR